MATRFITTRLLAILTFFTLFTITSQQPGIAQETQTGILEPGAPGQAPSVWATPLELDFGPVGVDESSDVQVVTITNTGDAPLWNFSDTSVTAPFNTTNSCDSGVLPGNSCQYSFWVTPSSAGDYDTTTTISTNAGPFTITMHTQGSDPKFTVSPLSLDFGIVTPTSHDLTVDSKAVQQIVVVRNIGIADLSGFSSGNVPAPFEVINDCPISLPLDGECRYYYNFFPTEDGTFNATSTVSTNAGSFTVKMTGQGQTSTPFTGQVVTPLEIDFGPVGIGSPGDPQAVILTNLSITKTIDNFMISDLAAPFNLSQDCTPSVIPGDNCTYTFNFAPPTPGTYITTSTTTNSAGTFAITLRGTGVSPELSASPLVLDFGLVQVGDTSNPQIVTVKNTGISMMKNIVINDVSSPFSGSQNCTNGLSPGETCELTFYYSPTNGVYTETTTLITTNGISSGIEITLMGGIKPPTVTKRFIPDTIPVEGVSTLQLAISNPNLAATLFNVAITDTFPAGMVIATPVKINWSECDTPTLITAAGKGSFSLADWTIWGGKTCSIQLDVTAPLPKDYINTTGKVRSRDGIGGVAKATLKVGIFNYLPYVSR